MAQNILDHYIQHDYTGANTSNVKQGACNAAPPPGGKNRSAWRPLFTPLGPIGLFLSQLHEKGAAMDGQFNIVAHGWPDTNLMTCPMQELKPKIALVATTARTQAITRSWRWAGEE